MKQTLRKLLPLLLALTLLLPSLAACGPAETGGDIVILYTGDVHCGIEESIGYAGLAAYKKFLESKTPYVTLVDLGDAIQGDYVGTVSQGTYIARIMNHLGYDYAVLGNHEFDYGMEPLSAVLELSEARYLGCNVTYSGSGENLLASLQPYALETYGDTTVAFIGVTTPESITSSTPSHFMEEGQYVYGFTAGNDGRDLYACVQNTIDTCREQGADYVILLTHLGDTEEYSPFSSADLIQNTRGADAVLDSHAHNTIPCRTMANADGDPVLLSATGTKLANIGQLTIGSSGILTSTLISGYSGRDSETVSLLNEIQSAYETEKNMTVATSDITLSCTSESGARMVRNRETAIGNFCADAYRTVAGADIGIVNGGGIRADLEAGDVSYGDIIAIHPFSNTLCVAVATGQEILDSLELSYRHVEAVAEINGVPQGEEGNFFHVSGLKLTIDTSKNAAFTFDENDMLVSVSGDRRVQDVQVLQSDGTYLPLDPAGTYTVASHNYFIKEGGGGNCLLQDNELLVDEGIEDYTILIQYLTQYLDGKLGSLYSGPEGRITIR